jgi:cysteine desulfurase
MTGRSYLDWNATAPLRPEARAATERAHEAGGNPSSVHAEGRAARHLVEAAREQVAALIGAQPRNVVFTSGGTEANMLALTPGLRAPGSDRGCEHLLVSAIEHPSVLSGGRFSLRNVETLPVTRAGVIDLDELRRRLEGLPSDARPLVSIMAANNETGVIQPVAQAAEIVHATGGLLHVDAVQAAGRIELDINELAADLVTISAHKIGGPQGAGALIWRDEALQLGEPLIRGGGQERGLRAGTENVAAIAGFGAAAVAAKRDLGAEAARLRVLREHLESGLRSIAPETVIFGQEAERVPNTVLFATLGIKAETALIALDLEGISVSSGAACSSGKITPSHVLAAMGVAPEIARGAIRASLGYSTQERDIDRLLQAWRLRVEALRIRKQEIAA